MEAHTVQHGLAADLQPRAKDGGVAAGLAAVIREIGALLTASGGLVVVVIGVLAVMTITTASMASVPEEQQATVAAGAFTVLGTIIGAAIMTVIQIGCSQKGLPNWVQQIVTGGIIVIAVALDRVRSARVT